MSRLKQLVTRLRRPDMREVAVAQVSDKYSEYPSNGLTPVKLAEILLEADAGVFFGRWSSLRKWRRKALTYSVSSDAQERRHGP